MITTDMVRIALDIPERDKIALAKLHPWQFFMWEELAVAIGALQVVPEEMPMFGTAPIRFIGIPIEQDVAMQHDVIQFLDSEGNVLSEIYALAIPVGVQ